MLISATIYIGIYYKLITLLYWDSDPNKGPIHLIKLYISITRSEQIKCYCYISDSNSDKAASLNLLTNN